jgi:uncharacterized protein YndB with AHSA1/START domain
MAVRHRLIKASPDTVWAVHADGTLYADWVVGTSASRPVRGSWPGTGAAIRYQVRLGPVRLTNETIVRRCVNGSALELEIQAGALGTARVAIELRPWGEHCLVLVDEHPLQGAGSLLHNAGVEMLIQLRHRAMLARLARLCEDRTASADTPVPGRPAAAGPAKEGARG